MVLLLAVANTINIAADVSAIGKRRGSCWAVPAQLYMRLGLGLTGTGFVAIPVLAGSAAYAMDGAFKWQRRLELPPSRAIASTASSLCRP